MVGDTRLSTTSNAEKDEKMNLTERVAYVGLVEYYARIYEVFDVAADEASVDASGAQPITRFFRPMMSPAQERQVEDLENRANDARQGCDAVLTEAEGAGVEQADVLRMAYVLRSDRLLLAERIAEKLSRSG